MICVSLARLGFDECVRAIGKTDFAEVRIDKLLEFSDDQFRTIFSIKRKVVATCRAEGVDDVRRMELLKIAIEAGAGYVDIEYEADEAYRTEMIDFAEKFNCIAIISYHNFTNTPTTEELDNIIYQSFSWGADRVKVTTMAHTVEDNARVMGLYERHKQLIAFTMGKIGSITRVAAPLLGADFTYAAYNNKVATAAGQLTVGQLEDIYDILK